MNNEDLYKQTLKQYNDPDFAEKYAKNISDRVNKALFSKFLVLIPKGCKILDVASAAGRDSAYLHSLGYRVTGIDLSSKLTEIARKNNPNIEFVIADFTRMPFTDDSFDAIWCNAAIVHMPSQESIKKAIQEFHRVLKSGGIITIKTKSRGKGEPETIERTDSISDKKRFFRLQEKDEFTKLVEENGFEIIESNVYTEESSKYKIKRSENWLTVTAKKQLDYAFINP
jgi:ubiquinone/menaquinone biosynthesis C-methylase UbiE